MLYYKDQILIAKKNSSKKLRITSVNITKSAVSSRFVTFTEKIPNGKLLPSENSKIHLDSPKLAYIYWINYCLNLSIQKYLLTSGRNSILKFKPHNTLPSKFLSDKRDVIFVSFWSSTWNEILNFNIICVHSKHYFYSMPRYIVLCGTAILPDFSAFFHATQEAAWSDDLI